MHLRGRLMGGLSLCRAGVQGRGGADAAAEAPQRGAVHGGMHAAAQPVHRHLLHAPRFPLPHPPPVRALASPASAFPAQNLLLAFLMHCQNYLYFSSIVKTLSFEHVGKFSCCETVRAQPPID